MITAHINIGSNIGDRAANCDRAVAMFGRLGTVAAVSSPVFTAPWGYVSPNEFMNIGVNLLTSLPPVELLAGLLAIEREIDPHGSHRTPNGGYADRAIDIDLIAYGDLAISEPCGRLEIPHPRMALREFVLAPMAEILPLWRHPLLNLTAKEMLAHNN